MHNSLRSQTVDYYLGKFERCFCGYSNNEAIRKNAASGGMVTQLIIYMLQNNYIDGVLISRLFIKNGSMTPRSFIATTLEEVMRCQTSIYIDFNLAENIKDVENFNGRLAVIGLPCQLKLFDRLKNADKIIKIGLFCGHNSKKDLIENVLKGKVGFKEIEGFYFRKGHWRGYSQILLKSKEVINFPYFDFGMFQNLFFHMPEKCLYCRDHAAEASDISFGDIWLAEFKKKKAKYSCIISRRKKITDILLEMKNKGTAIVDALSPDKIIASQKRPLIYHKFTTSALKKIRHRGAGHNCKWNDYVAASLILFNMNIAQKKVSRLIYKLPRRLVSLYMIFVRVFLSF